MQQRKGAYLISVGSIPGMVQVSVMNKEEWVGETDSLG